MSIIQWLGLILFAVLLFKVLQTMPVKIQRFRAGQRDGKLDLATSTLAIAFCLWAIVRVFSFPN